MTDVIVVFYFGLFFALLSPNSPKYEHEKKRKKYLEISSFYNHVPKIMIICYTVSEIRCVTDVGIYFSFWAIFCHFTSLTARKIKISKNWKKLLEISSLYTHVPKIMIRWCTVCEIWCVTDVINFHFRPFFAILTSQQPKKSKLKKKWKKHLKISSFYTSVPKITIICYTDPEIWCITDVIVIFNFGLLFDLLPPPPP